MILLDSAGQQATVNSERFAQDGVIEAHLDNGQIIRLPQSAVTRRDDGAWVTALRFDELAQAADAVVVPVVAETMTVTRRDVEAGRVRVTKTVHEDEADIDELLRHDEVEVERREINQYVEAAPETRTEGNTLIVPIVEEVLVVEKRLLLREELRITRRQTEERHAETVTLRREEAHVERFNGNQVEQSRTGG